MPSSRAVGYLERAERSEKSVNQDEERLNSWIRLYRYRGWNMCRDLLYHSQDCTDSRDKRNCFHALGENNSFGLNFVE